MTGRERFPGPSLSFTLQMDDEKSEKDDLTS